MTIEKERSFSTQLAAAWRFTKVAPSIDGLQNALDHRLVDLDIIASEEGARGQVDRSSRIAAISWLHLDFLSAAAVAVKLFNRYVNEHGARWALLFDELELAPRWQQELLLRYLRSVDEHFLFKLSMSPFEAGNTADHYDQTGLPTRQSRQDYDRIRLWYVNKTESFPFCRELLSTMLRQRNLTNLAAEDVFGHARLRSDPDDDSQLTVYRSNSSTGKLFKRLAARDPTFRDFLRRRDVDLGNLEAVSGIPRAANLRKGISIIALREYFKGEGREMAEERRTQRRRSRKVPTVYAGTESLFAMVEGNPRWFKGIVGQLLQGVTAQSPRVSGAAQVREVLNAVHVFRAMLRTVPVSTQQRKTRGLLSILDPIGNYFSKASIDAPFNPDPPASVTVDSRTDDETLRSLGIALDAGAIVYVDDDEGILGPNGLRGKRIRLAYLLAPYYHSPLRLGPPIALSTILNAKDDVPLEPPHVFDDALLWERT